MLNKYTLLSAQILAHISLIILIYTGNYQDWLICLFVYFLNGCIGMTVTYHRGLSHRSWNMPKLFEYVGILCATIGMTGSAITWVSIHRKHHIHTDKPNDPHSPKFKGFVYCQWLTMFEPVSTRYVTDLVANKFCRFQQKYYFHICITYGLILLFINPYLIISAFLAPAAILWNAGSSIVTLGHLFGKQGNWKKDFSRNNWVLAFLVWGEGWHNNHHENPSSPRYGRYWWQWDPGYYIIKLFNEKNGN